MKRQILFFIAAISLSSWIGQNALANDPCSDVLKGAEKNLDQEKIKAHEESLHALMQEYGQKLGLFQDPFAMVFNVEQGERVFRRLSVRVRNGRWANSPLSIINFNLKKAYLAQRAYNEKLIQWIIEDTSNGLKLHHAERVDLQSNLLALKYSFEYLRRYKEPEAIVDRDGNKKEDPKPEKKKKKEEQEEEDTEPYYPETPKEYQPFTKDAQSGGGKQKKHQIAEVNFKTPFFAQRHFSEVVRGAHHPFREAVLPSIPANPGKTQQTTYEQIIRTYGKRKVDLFLPPLYKPLQPTDPRAVISRSETGGYVLTLNEDLPEIRIPLVEDTHIFMMPHERQIYTRPVGFKQEEWPAQVQADIIRKYSLADAQANPLQVAQAIANHIATEYLYSVGPRPETEPVDAMKAGAFQCDMAAYAMVGLLRDVYQIPSRAVGGFRAKKYQSGKDGKSYLVVPGEGHAWVEVFHDGKWNLFDPTPIKKDSKDGEGSSDDYADQSLENTPKAEEDQDQSGEPSGNPAQGSENKKSHQERLDEDTQRRTDSKKGGEGKSEEKKPPSNSEAKDTSQADELTKEELANQLELGSLELEPKADSNVLLERAMRVLLRETLDPSKQGSEIQNRLNQISSLLRRFHSPQLKSIVQKAKNAHQNEHPGIKEWIDQLTRRMAGQDINKSHQELYRIRLALETYSKVLDTEGRIQAPIQLINLLADIQRRIESLSHPDSQAIGLVQDMVKDLPSVTRQLLKDQFDLTQVGPNAATKEVASKLKAGKLNDLRLLSILGPLSDFILNSTPRPETIEIKTWQRNPARPRGRDLLPLQRFSDLSRAIFTQPGKSAEDNLREGTAYVQTRRQRVRIPQGYGKEEAERITIVLYDTSGSMDGDPARFQAGLISAFTAKALSDTSPSGRHRHRVVIVPFDDAPGTPLRVTNTQEAIDVIRNYRKVLKNTKQGTDIQKALLQAMSLIADAEKRAGEPLAAANIVLMTDGQAQIDSDELLRARRAIDRQTPLQTMFIAINGSNEELMQFAMDSQRMGSEKGFYREFTPEHMKDILHDADTLNLKDRQDFYSDKTAKELPPEVYSLMEQALRLGAQFSDQIYYGSQYTPARSHLENLEKVKWLDLKQVDRPLEKWLIKVRQLAQHPIFKDRRLLERVVDDLVTNMSRLTGIEQNTLSDHEQEHLRHLVRYAAGLEEEVW